MKTKILLALFFAALWSCKSNDPHDVDPIDPGDGDVIVPPDQGIPLPAPYTNLTWTITQVEAGSSITKAGMQGKLLRGGDGTLYYAYFKRISTTENTCDIAVFSTGGPMPGINFDVKVAVLAPGATTWDIETLPLANLDPTVPYVTNIYGLEGVINSNDQPVFVFAGGSPSVTASCGSSDLVRATRTGKNTWNLNIPVTDSVSCCGYCAAENCQQGDVVGPWACATLDGNNSLAIAFMDYHFLWDEDGYKKRGLELWQESGSVTGIKTWAGKGMYSQLKYLSPKDGAEYSGLIAAYTTSQSTGLYVARLIGDPNQKDAWDEQDIRTGDKIGERISMAVAPDGTVGIAFYRVADKNDQPKQDLVYCYSTDNGEIWVEGNHTCETVDQENSVGQYPSLTYDKDSRALISYYYCGVGGNCTPAGDGLRFAIRTGVGSWVRRNVSFDAANMTGVFSQIVVNPDTYEPTIVFQDVTRGFAMMAQGKL
ncbi:MAG: hypothetical protein JW841_00340 [Deltaproteobacteria bacterium]|nr:hypothetical protein [Deltaproteobacteria bacterium]